MKKLKLFMLFIATLLISCNNDDGQNTEQPATDSSYNAGNTVNRNFHGIVLDTSGNPVVSATVSIGSSSTQTNSKGIFVLNNASVKERFAFVKVSKSGYVDGSRVLAPTAGENRVNIMLVSSAPTATVASGVNSEVSLSNGTKVKFDGAFKDASGNAYIGNVDVSLYHLKTSNTYLSEIMPGSLLASNTNGDSKVLETFGMLHVELTGSGGQKLNIATGHTAEITLDIDATQAGSSPSTIPLWTFDETTGIWKEEGSATKVGNKYVGTVSHFSWWNCDYPFDRCNLAITVNNSAGQPISNLIVGISRIGQVATRTGFTDSSGQVNGIVPGNESLTLTINDFCGNIIYTATIGPFSIGSLNVLPAISLSPSSINTVTVNGTLKTCSNANVTNGMAILRKPISIYYFDQIMQPVTNGAFSFVTSICGTSQQFIFQGEDYTNLQTSSPITFTATSPVTNIGTITTCTSANEFITYQVDSDPTRYFITGLNATYSSANGLNISTPQSNPFFYLGGTGITGIGTYSTNYNMEVTLGSGLTGFSGTGNNVQLVVSQIGAVGGYIDFTVNGTFTDLTGNPTVHTITGTGHVIRD
jgi:hypothetical protein